MNNSPPLSSPAISPSQAAIELLRRRAGRNGLFPFAKYTKDDYIEAPHLKILRDKLEAVERGDLKRLIVVMPPRHGKSELVSLRFPCYYLAKHPTHYVVQSGYAESIALTHSRKARDIFCSPSFHMLFPAIHHRPQTAGQDQVLKERQSAHEWGTKQGGSYYAVGLGGGLTGRGFDLGIIDDPVKDSEEAESVTYRERAWDWYTQVFRTRLAPDAAIIVVMTRWHEDDLVGRLLNIAKEDPEADQWEVLRFPAISADGKALWPERYSLVALKTIRALNKKSFESLYQGNPTVAKGQIIRRDWWQYYSERPPLERTIQSWDTAFKDKQHNDYSVCALWGVGSNGFYLLDIWREKVQFPELKRAAVSLYNRDHPDVTLIEDKASGQSLIQELQRDTRIPLLPIQVDKDKVARAYAATPLIEAGKVFLPKNAPWLHDFIEEHSAFPNGTHDDQVDTTTQALAYLRLKQQTDHVTIYDAGQLVNMDL